MGLSIRSLAMVISMAVGTAAFSPAAWAESVQVVIQLQPKVQIDDLAKSVTDPSSSRYQKFYTPEEIREIAGPSDADYQSVLQKLKADGVEIVAETRTHLFVTVRGERAYFEKLDSKLRSVFKDVVGFFSKTVMESIHGLGKIIKRKPHLIINPMASQTGFTGLTPAQIRTAYGFDAIYNQGITGAGQDIAIASYSGFYLQDVLDYRTKNGISGGTVDQVTFNGTPKLDAESAAETQTDAEFSGMIAPGANIHIFASADNSDTGEIAVFTAILDDNRSKILNYSWGTCESDLAAAHKTAMDQIFAQAVAQGINVMVATGDEGSDCKGNNTVVADFPAVEPYVVAVGGTSLTLGSTPSETAWSGNAKTGASGGGYSTLYSAPSFQEGITNSSMRAYPDVAFNADPKSGEPTWVHIDPHSQADKPSTDANYIVIGGTSIAAPQWSGFMALVNQARGGKGALGYLDPIIYPLAQQNQNQYFNDVTSGSNGAYSAAAGWDAVTGWGSMKADVLLSYLQNN